MILADEPTASLDPKNTAMILELLEKLRAVGTTIIFATHDTSLFSLVPSARVIDVTRWSN